MDAALVVRSVWEGMEARNWGAVRRLVADDVVVTWPQTRERIRGGDAFVEVNRTYPGDWHITVEEVLAEGERAAARVTIVLGENVFYASGFYRVRHGRIVEATEMFGDPGEPPYDRSHLTERY
ncbi:nuclear transport factor 2 family protein [Polyangium sp. 15x6]|uniref:nuclear transport factor 2 family protein n=1 Tax=Polyangium sp. 15x6 TaxID=3042687 RepID=UPI00249A4AF3|nr:nuclear transport factor 2 family protein [Polyangium sp. 15x6]MDI3288503.1 nuclear transport factor 2 family protein [Polyangium sp. 15x6]